MNKDVIITINGLQYAQTEDGSEPLEVIAPGEYFYKNGNHYLLYEDAADFGEEKTKNILKFRPEYLEVIKKGAYTTKLVFEKDKKTLSQYETPMGVLYIGISTTSVSLLEEPDSIEMTAKYAMDINSNFIADCTVCVQARSKSGGFTLMNS